MNFLEALELCLKNKVRIRKISWRTPAYIKYNFSNLRFYDSDGREVTWWSHIEFLSTDWEVVPFSEHEKFNNKMVDLNILPEDKRIT